MMMVMIVMVVGCMLENSSRQESRSLGSRLLVSRHLHKVLFWPYRRKWFQFIKTKTGSLTLKWLKANSFLIGKRVFFRFPSIQPVCVLTADDWSFTYSLKYVSHVTQRRKKSRWSQQLSLCLLLSELLYVLMVTITYPLPSQLTYERKQFKI